MPRRRRQHDPSTLPRRGRATAVVAGVTVAWAALLLGGSVSRGSDPCTISWDGGAGTARWVDRANWTDDRKPGGDDAVCIGAGRAVEFGLADAKVAGLRVDGSLTITSLELEIGTTRESEVTGSLTLSDGGLVVDGDVPIASFRQSGGFLLGSGRVLTPDLVWTGGRAQGAGATEVIPGGPGATIEGDKHTLDQTHTLRIQPGATAAWTGGDLELNDHARIVNSGLLDVRGDLDFVGCCGVAPEVVNEAGATILKSGGDGTAQLNYPMANDGTIDVLRGTFAIAGGSVRGRASSGSFEVEDGARLLFPSGTTGLDAESSVLARGTGQVEMTGGQTHFAGSVDAPVVLDGSHTPHAFFESPVTLRRIRLESGALAGSGTVATPDFTWTGGVQYGDGTTRIDPGGPGLAIAGEGRRTLDGRRLEIARGAAATWSSGGLGMAAGAQLENGGLLDIQADALMETLCCGSAPLLHNAADATLRKSAGPGRSTIGVGLQNDGTVEASSGTLDLSAGLGNLVRDELHGGRYVVTATLAVAGAHVRGNAAGVVLDGPGSRIEDSSGADALRDLDSNLPDGDLTLTGGRALAPEGDLANAGQVTLAEGAALAPAGSYRQSDGVTALAASDAVIRAGAGARLAGGLLRGFGTVEGNLVNGAAVDPGLPPRTLTVTGDYAQTGDGALYANVNPFGATSRLDVGGRADLAGTLRIRSFGYQPTPQAEVELVRHGSETAEFDAVEGLAPDPVHSYSPPDYAPDAVWLRPGAVPAASIGDAAVTEGDQGDASATFQVTLDPVPTRAVRIDWRTVDGTASAAADYETASGTLTIPHGRGTADIVVPVHADTADEPDETFTVELSSPANTTLGRDHGTATILDDDAAPPGHDPPPGHNPPPGDDPPPGHKPPPTHRPPHRPPPRCIDHLAPRSRIGLAKARKRRLQLRGTARDFGCARLRNVSVAVALHKHNRCRFLKKDGRLGKARRCRRTVWIKATGTRKWRLRATPRLPKGRYTIRTRAVDRAVNKEKKRRKTNFRRLRLR